MSRNLMHGAKSLTKHIVNWPASPRVAQLVGEPFFHLLGMRRKGKKIDLSQGKRVLVVRLDEIGDVAMTTPLIRELRQNLPDAWITLLVNPGVYNLVELSPYVNEVLTYDPKTNGYFGQLRRHGRALWLAWLHLWKRRFDLAILPRWDADHYNATFVTYFSGAPWRVGYSANVIDNKKRLNNGYDRLLTHRLEDNEPRHEVERNLDLIRFLGGEVRDDQLELWPGKQDEIFARDLLRKHGVQATDTVIAFGTSGGNSALKQWPVDRFAKLARWLQIEYKAHILLVGGPGEEALGEEIDREIGFSSINAIGKTTLRQLAALLTRCRLYVGNDAGPMHVAAAMRIPVIALFGSSCHHRFGPWGRDHKVIWPWLRCSPCFRNDHGDRCGECVFDRPQCMLDITVEQVKQRVVECLGEPHAAPEVAEPLPVPEFPVEADVVSITR